MTLYVPSSKLFSLFILLSLVINCGLNLLIGSLGIVFKLVLLVMPLPC